MPRNTRASPRNDPLRPALRVFRHAGTGLVVELDAGPVAGPGKERWWRIGLLRQDGRPGAVEGFAPIIAVRTRAEARQAYAERQRVLLAAGYERTNAE